MSEMLKQRKAWILPAVLHNSNPRTLISTTRSDPNTHLGHDIVLIGKRRPVLWTNPIGGQRLCQLINVRQRYQLSSSSTSNKSNRVGQVVWECEISDSQTHIVMHIPALALARGPTSQSGNLNALVGALMYVRFRMVIISSCDPSDTRIGIHMWASEVEVLSDERNSTIGKPANIREYAEVKRRHDEIVYYF